MPDSDWHQDRGRGVPQLDEECRSRHDGHELAWAVEMEPTTGKMAQEEASKMAERKAPAKRHELVLK